MKRPVLNVLAAISALYALFVIVLTVIALYQVSAGHGNHEVPSFLAPITSGLGSILFMLGSIPAGVILAEWWEENR